MSPSLANDDAGDGLFDKAVQLAQKRTVKIFGAGVGRAEGYATGLIVSPQGHILTANGVLLTGERIRVVMADGKVHYAVLKRRDEAVQTALLKIDVATPDHFMLPAKLPAKKGDWVVVVSNVFKVADGDEPLSVTLGVLSGITQVEGQRGVTDVRYDGDAVLIDCITSNGGGPGGAVVTVDGQLVGMIGRLLESKRANVRLNYAVPAPLLARFLAGKTVIAKTNGNTAGGGPVNLGIRLFKLGGKRAPAYVDGVLPRSPAAAAGIRSDDLILSLGGRKLRSVGDYEEAVKSLTFSKPIEILVKRKQKLLRLMLTPPNAAKKEGGKRKAEGGTNQPEGASPRLDVSPKPGASALRLIDFRFRLSAFGLLLDDQAPKSQSPEGSGDVRKGHLLAPKAFRAAVNRVRTAMVSIEAFGGVAPVKKKGRRGARKPGDGPTTGLIVSSDGYVLTSTYNLITRPPIITVVRADGSRHVAQLVGRDDTRRICLLKIAGVKDWPAAEYVAADSLRVGQWAVSAGLGLGSDPVISAGIISAKNRIGGRAVQTDANISPVNYGGPLVDVEGRVIGLCVPINPRTNDPSGGVEWYDSGIGFAIPLAGLPAVIDAMKSGKPVHPAALGVRVKDADAGKRGVEVLEVVKGSAADKAGILKGDRILKLGGRTVASATELRFALARFMAGQKTEVITQRDGKERKQSATLDRGAAPKPPAVKVRRKFLPGKRPGKK